LQKTLAVIVATVALVLVTMSAAPMAEVNVKGKKQLLKGKITSVEWINPNVIIHMDVGDPHARPTPWTIKCPPPKRFQSLGATKDAVQRGMEIVVYGDQPDETRNTIVLKSITLPDGKKIDLGR